jgi:hypothetical protein
MALAREIRSATSCRYLAQARSSLCYFVCMYIQVHRARQQVNIVLSLSWIQLITSVCMHDIGVGPCDQWQWNGMLPLVAAAKQWRSLLNFHAAAATSAWAVVAAKTGSPLVFVDDGSLRPQLCRCNIKVLLIYQARSLGVIAERRHAG